MAVQEQQTPNPIQYSCYVQKTKEDGRFVKEHIVTRIISGNLKLHTATESYDFKAGDSFLIKRNQLVKASKMPPLNGMFESVSVYFKQSTIRDFVLENKLESSLQYRGPSIVPLTPSPLYDSYSSSLAAYQKGTANESLTLLKVKEALMLLIHLDKETSNMLCDFSEPGKIDLQEFMNNHFTFNVTNDRLAYLTGRSLATFKRDFAREFNTSPNKWLQKRRLSEAYYLIREKKKKISDVYLEVGFEDLSHFSFAFKNAFGKSPANI